MSCGASGVACGAGVGRTVGEGVGSTVGADDIWGGAASVEVGVTVGFDVGAAAWAQPAATTRTKTADSKNKVRIDGPPYPPVWIGRYGDVKRSVLSQSSSRAFSSCTLPEASLRTRNA